MHLLCPPKFCISIVFYFFWDGCNTQEPGEMKNKGNAKFWGPHRMHYGKCGSYVQQITEREVGRLMELAFINWRDLKWSFLNYCLVTRYLFNQTSRGPLHKAATSGQYETVKMLLESGEDVDQRDQVLVFSSLCNFWGAEASRPTSRFRLAWGFLLSFLCIYKRYTRRLIKEWDNEMRSCANVSLKATFH